MKTLNTSLSTIWFTTCLVATGCVPRMPPVAHAEPPAELKDTATRLDRVAAGLAEFGTVGISNPLLTQPNDSFKFVLDAAKTDTFFTDAKTSFQGRAAEFEQVSQSLSIGASLAADPTIAAAHSAQVMQYLHAQQQNAARQSILDEKLRLQNQAAATTYLQEQAAAEEAYRKAVAGAGGDAQKVADAEAARTGALSSAKNKYAGALQVPDAVDVPAFPTTPAQPAGADAGLAKEATDARGRIAAMTGFGGLLAGKAGPTLSNRSAIITAAGDTTTKAIFQVLGNPALGSAFQDRIVVFGVSMVSVNPGWRTSRGYAADISVVCKFAYRPADYDVVRAFVNDESIDPAIRRRVAQDGGVALPASLVAGSSPVVGQIVPENLTLPGKDQFLGIHIDEGATPLVAAVSPMTETDALDLASGNRRQEEFALNLSFALRAAGLGAQASAFEQFVKSRQQDVATASAVAAVNSYSYSGGQFGFQVGPRLRAIAEVKSKRYSGPAGVLDRQSFPVLILFGLDRSELYRIHEDKGQWLLYQAQLVLISTPSWTPMEPSVAGAPLTETTRLGWSADMAAALKHLGSDTSSPAQTRALAYFRANAMRWKVFGSGVVVELPATLFTKAAPPPASTSPASAGSSGGASAVADGRRPEAAGGAGH